MPGSRCQSVGFDVTLVCQHYGAPCCTERHFNLGILALMIRIRAADIHDVPLVFTMIRELAEFERELEFVTITEEDLRRDGFGDDPKFRAFIAEWDGNA